MEPNQNQTNQDTNSQPGVGQPAAEEKSDAYAQSLLQSVNMQLEMERRQKPARQLISRKKLIFIIISIILTIISAIAIAAVNKQASSDASLKNTDSLRQTDKYLQDISN